MQHFYIHLSQFDIFWEFNLVSLTLNSSVIASEPFGFPILSKKLFFFLSLIICFKYYCNWSLINTALFILFLLSKFCLQKVALLFLQFIYSCRRFTLAKWSDVIKELLSFFMKEYELFILLFVYCWLNREDLLIIGRYFFRIS